MTTVWHGTDQEAEALRRAVSHHCQCRWDATGEHGLVCEPHRLLTDDQRALDHLVYVYRRRDRYQAAEFGEGGQPCA